jgi:cellobiose-specific phosphotransferase system component IIA
MAKPKVKDEEVLPLEARVTQCIHDFPTPKTSQDALDRAAAEYMVANLLRQQADKRYENAKRTIVAAHEVDIALLRNQATETMMKVTKSVMGVDWSIMISVNKPVVSTNADDLRTELIKLGVSAKLIDEAKKKAEKKFTPALSITTQRE